MTDRPVAFITGASRGIGRSIAIELAQRGFDIAGGATAYEADPARPGLAEVKAQVEASGADFLPVPGDISDLETHPRMLSTLYDRFPAIDVLVNNAGIAPVKRLDILETTPESFDRVLAVNTRGTFFLTQAVARHMAGRTGDPKAVPPAIVFITSISAYVSSPSRAEYCISKAATSSAVRLFAHRLTEFGIHLYEVRPGITRTDMTKPVADQYDDLIKRGLVPQGRWGEGGDVARAVAALVGGDFTYSTGLIVEVSGGMQIHRL